MELKTKPNRTISKLIDLTLTNKIQWDNRVEKFKDITSTIININKTKLIKVNIVNLNKMNNLYVDFYLFDKNKKGQKYIATYYNVSLNKLFELYIMAKYINNIDNNPHFFNEIIDYDLDWEFKNEKFYYILDNLPIEYVFDKDKVAYLVIDKGFAIIKINDKDYKLYKIDKKLYYHLYNNLDG